MFLFCFTLHSLPFILQHFVKCFFMFFLEHIMCFSWFISRTALPPQHTRTQTHTNKIYKESKRLALFTLYRKTPWGDDDCGDMSGWHGLLASACVCARLLSLASRRVLRQDGVSVCVCARARVNTSGTTSLALSFTLSLSRLLLIFSQSYQKYDGKMPKYEWFVTQFPPGREKKTKKNHLALRKEIREIKY